MTPNTDKLCFSISYKVFTELSKNSIINASPNPAAKPNKIPIKILRLLSFKFLFGKEARSNICTLPTKDATFSFAFLV